MLKLQIENSTITTISLGLAQYAMLCEKQDIALTNLEFDDDNGISETDTETVQYLLSINGFFIDKTHCIKTWKALGTDFHTGHLTDALRALERLSTPEFKERYGFCLSALEHNIQAFGDSQSRTRALITAAGVLYDD